MVKVDKDCAIIKGIYIGILIYIFMITSFLSNVVY